MKALTATFVLICMLAQADACTCDSPSVERMVGESAAVFIGSVVRLEVAGDDIICTLGDVEVLKGEVGVDHLTVKNPRGVSTCGVGFEIDQRYLVFATLKGGGLFTSRCHRTKSMWTLKNEFEREPYGELEADMVRALLGLPARQSDPEGTQEVHQEK